MRKVSVTSGIVAAAVLSFSSSTTFASVTVWLDFGGNWASELNEATTAAGIANFDPTERTQIEDGIVTQLEEVYENYQVSFTKTNPGGTRVHMEFDIDQTGQGSTLGFVDFIDSYNLLSSSDHVSMIPFNLASFHLESGDSRPTQMAELTRGASGTAAHELGHSFGLMHQHAYGNPGITPANYANTGGLQNQHILATGQSGLSEAQREAPRSFNRWERALLDVTGSFGGNSVVNTPVTAIGEVGDLPSTSVGAPVIPFGVGETSDMLLRPILADFDSEDDVDVYAIAAPGPGTIIAEIFSWIIDQSAGGFLGIDGVLRLLDTDGTTVLASNDNPSFNGNVFQVGGDIVSLDPLLMNIPIPAAGTYYLEVSAAGLEDEDDQYTLVVAFIPEPTAIGLLALAVPMLMRRRR